MNMPRYPVAATTAAFATGALFLLMTVLISGTDIPVRDLVPFTGIHFSKVEIPEESPPKTRVKPEYQPPKPVPRIPVPDDQPSPRAEPPPLDAFVPSLGLPGDGVPWLPGPESGSGSEYGDIVALVAVRPAYPRQAAIAGTEGWVTVEFTVTPLGTVTDPRVVAADPPRVFDLAALRAIVKWKFKPRVVDGEARPQRVQQTIQFHLDDDS